MTKPPSLIRNRADAVVNIRGFRDAVDASPGLQDRLAYARAWYALWDDAAGRWLFAPSKWVGYRDLSPAAYVDNAATSMDGRRTEARLRRWFVALDQESERHAELLDELTEFVGRYGKTPSAEARISVVDAAEEASEDDLAELIVRVVKSLDGARQARIRRGLRI